MPLHFTHESVGDAITRVAKRTSFGIKAKCVVLVLS